MEHRANTISSCGLHYSWVICAMCILVMLFNPGLANSSFSIHLPFMRTFAGITDTQCSTILLVRNAASLAALFIIDYYLNWLGPRVGIAVGMALSTAGFFLFSVLHSFPGYCISAVITGFGYSFGGMLPVSLLINHWFHAHRGLALGLCSAGTGAATMAASPVITALANRFSLPITFRTEAIAILVVGVLVFLLLRNTPEEMGLVPLTAEKADVPRSVPMVHESTAKAGSMFLIYLSVMAYSFSTYGAHPCLSLFFTDQGIDMSTISYIISLLGIAMILGKCLFGVCADRFGIRRTSTAFWLTAMAGLCILCMTSSQRSLMIPRAGVFIWGVGNALSTVALPLFARELCGKNNYTKIAKQIQIAYMCGSLIVGPFPGMIAEATGGYLLAYVLFTTAALLSMVLGLTSLHLRKKQLNREAHS